MRVFKTIIFMIIYSLLSALSPQTVSAGFDSSGTNPYNQLIPQITVTSIEDHFTPNETRYVINANIEFFNPEPNDSFPAGVFGSATIETTVIWDPKSKIVRERTEILSYYMEVELAESISKWPTIGDLTAECPADPVIFEGDCTKAQPTGLYNDTGKLKNIRGWLISRNILTEEQKASLRHRLEITLAPPSILKPIPNEIFGVNYRKSENEYQIPVFVTLLYEAPIKLDIKKISSGPKQSLPDQKILFPSTDGNITPYGIYYELNLLLAEGKYEITATPQNFQEENISDISNPVQFLVGSVDAKDLDSSQILLENKRPDISNLDKKDLLAKVPAESSQMSGSGTVVPIDPEKEKVLSPAAESSLKAYTLGSNQVVSPVEGRKYQAITKDSDNTSSIAISFLVRSPQPISPNFVLKKRIFKEPFKNYEDWSGDAIKMGESNNYQYETTRNLGPGEYQLLTSFEPGKNKLIYFRVLGDEGDDDISSIGRVKREALIDEKPALASLAELQLVSPEANKSYSSSELPGAADDAPPLYPVLIKAICPVKTGIGIELKKRLSIDSSYHTVRTWTIDMTKLKEEARGYSYEMTRPLGAGNYYLEVSGFNENLKNYNQPIKRYFRVLGDSKQLLEVAEEQNLNQKVQKIIIEPRQNQIYNTFQQDKVQFVYWLKLPYSSPVRMRIKKDSAVVLSETLAASDGGGKKEYRGYKQLPAGVYTIEVMLTNTPASGQVDASGQTKYIAEQWSGPVTFYLGSSEMAQRNGDSQVSGGLSVTPDRSAVKKPSSAATRSPITAPALMPLPRGAAFSVNSLTSLPVKHAAGQKPVYEFEYYDGRAWRMERSIRPISMQTPQGNGMTQVITKTSFRISKPGKYRYRVTTDASGSPSSPYQEFVVVDPRAQSMAQVSAQSSRAKAAADPAAAGAPGGAMNVVKSPNRTAQPPRPPDNSADLSRGKDTATPQPPAQRQLMPPSTPPKITAPRHNQSFSAPANVMVKTSHDSRFDLVFEMSKDMGKPLMGSSGDLRQLAPGKYRIKVGYKGRPQRSQVDFVVKIPTKKQAIQARPQHQKAPATQPSGQGGRYHRNT